MEFFRHARSFDTLFSLIFPKTPSFHRGTHLAFSGIRARLMRDEKHSFVSGGSMTTQTLADRGGVSAEVVRYYTKRGLLKPTRNRRNNYRLYRESDVARLRFIRRAKNLGYTLKEIGKIIEQSKRGESPCPLAREIIERRIADNRKKLDEMLELQTRIEAASAKWATMPDKVPDGNTICYLIESTSEI